MRLRSFLLLPILLLGCHKGSKAPQAPKTQEIRFNIHSEPPSLDPRKSTDLTSVLLIKLCFEGLTSMNRDNGVELALAKEVQISKDQKTYTFLLRDALWSDGKPVTAFDFEDTWKTILSPSFPCPFANDFYLIENAAQAKMGLVSLDSVGIKAPDEKTLIVTLAHPAEYFLSLTATHAFFAVPKHIAHVSPEFADHGGDLYVGNGPFHLKEWKHYRSLSFEKNPTYWDKDSVKLEKISCFLIEDEGSELAMYENGDVDWAGNPFSSLPLDAVPSLQKQGSLNIHEFAGIYFYIFNTKVYPFDNVHIRRAFTLAMNRKLIVDNITQLGQRVATAYVPPSLWKGQEVSYFSDNDVEGARKEFALGLAELGITKEEFPKVTLTYNTMSGHHKIAQAIQGQWLEVLGVHVALSNREWKVFLDELQNHKFQIARMGSVASFDDPMTFLDLYRYLSSSNNYSGWTNPTFTKLLDKSDLCTDEKERFKLLRAAEKLFLEDMPLAPIYFTSGGYLQKPYIKQVFLSNLNDINLKKAYIEVSP